MSVNFTITLSDAENKALGVVAYDQNDWIQNAIHERCRLAIEEVVQAEIERKFSIGEPIIGTKEELVMAAPVMSAKEARALYDAEREAEAAARGAQ